MPQPRSAPRRRVGLDLPPARTTRAVGGAEHDVAVRIRARDRERDRRRLGRRHQDLGRRGRGVSVGREDDLVDRHSVLARLHPHRLHARGGEVHERAQQTDAAVAVVLPLPARDAAVDTFLEAHHRPRRGADAIGGGASVGHAVRELHVDRIVRPRIAVGAAADPQAVAPPGFRRKRELEEIRR